MPCGPRHIEAREPLRAGRLCTARSIHAASREAWPAEPSIRPLGGRGDVARLALLLVAPGTTRP
eukprot:8115459-Pyramimonas_sp.AAC.1